MLPTKCMRFLGKLVVRDRADVWVSNHAKNIWLCTSKCDSSLTDEPVVPGLNCDGTAVPYDAQLAIGVLCARQRFALTGKEEYN